MNGCNIEIEKRNGSATEYSFSSFSPAHSCDTSHAWVSCCKLVQVPKSIWSPVAQFRKIVKKLQKILILCYFVWQWMTGKHFFKNVFQKRLETLCASFHDFQDIWKDSLVLFCWLQVCARLVECDSEGSGFRFSTIFVSAYIVCKMSRVSNWESRISRSVFLVVCNIRLHPTQELSTGGRFSTYRTSNSWTFSCMYFDPLFNRLSTSWRLLLKKLPLTNCKTKVRPRWLMWWSGGTCPWNCHLSTQ